MDRSANAYHRMVSGREPQLTAGLSQRLANQLRGTTRPATPSQLALPGSLMRSATQNHPTVSREVELPRNGNSQTSSDTTQIQPIIRGYDDLVQRIVSALTPLINDAVQNIQTTRMDRIESSLQGVTAGIESKVKELETWPLKLAETLEKAHALHLGSTHVLAKRVKALETLLGESSNKGKTVMSQLDTLSFLIGDVVEKLNDPEANEQDGPTHNEICVGTTQHTYADSGTDPYMHEEPIPVRRFMSAGVGTSPERTFNFMLPSGDRAPKRGTIVADHIDPVPLRDEILTGSSTDPKPFVYPANPIDPVPSPLSYEQLFDTFVSETVVYAGSAVTQSPSPSRSRQQLFTTPVKLNLSVSRFLSSPDTPRPLQLSNTPDRIKLTTGILDSPQKVFSQETSNTEEEQSVSNLILNTGPESTELKSSEALPLCTPDTPSAQNSDAETSMPQSPSLCTSPIPMPHPNLLSPSRSTLSSPISDCLSPSVQFPTVKEHSSSPPPLRIPHSKSTHSSLSPNLLIQTPAKPHNSELFASTVKKPFSQATLSQSLQVPLTHPSPIYISSNDSTPLNKITGLKGSLSSMSPMSLLSSNDSILIASGLSNQKRLEDSKKDWLVPRTVDGDGDDDADIIPTKRPKLVPTPNSKSFSGPISGSSMPGKGNEQGGKKSLLKLREEGKKGQTAGVTRVKKRKMLHRLESDYDEPPLKKARQKVKEKKEREAELSTKKNVADSGRDTGRKSEKMKVKRENTTSPSKNKRRTKLGALPVKWPKKTQSQDLAFDQKFLTCDICSIGYHYACVGIVEGDNRIKTTELFTCPPCEVGSTAEPPPVDASAKNAICGRPGCPHAILQSDDIYYVSGIVGRKTKVEGGRGKKFMWLVKWDGYPITQATWEGEESMMEPHKLIEEFKGAAAKEGINLDDDPLGKILLREAIAGGWSQEIDN